jgi:Cu/Ag efflux protein CusF
MAVFALLLSASPLLADETHHVAAATDAVPAQPSSLAEGEVRRVDKETGKITIRHGPLVKLDMPPMTMVFVAKDPAMLERVKPGDKIRFEADKVDGVYVVTRIEAAP